MSNMIELLSKTSFRVVALLLLFQFGGDTLAVLDFLEPTGFGAYGTVEAVTSGVHMHTQADSDRQGLSVDNCVVCPCCVSTVNMFASTFWFASNAPQFGFYAFPTSQSHTWSEHQFFHPPRPFS